MIPSVTINFMAPAIVTVLLVADEADAEDDAADADDAATEDEGGDVVITIELGVDEDVVEDGTAEDDVDEVVVVVGATTADDTIFDDVAFKEADDEDSALVLLTELTGTIAPASLIASMYTWLHWPPCETS